MKLSMGDTGTRSGGWSHLLRPVLLCVTVSSARPDPVTAVKGTERSSFGGEQGHGCAMLIVTPEVWAASRVLAVPGPDSDSS